MKKQEYEQINHPNGVTTWKTKPKEQPEQEQKTCLVADEPCKHGSWCSEVYCQERCEFVEQPAQEPVDERALIRKVDAELAAAGIEAYTDVHNSRYRLLVAVRNFLAVSVDYLPGWLAQPAQAMRDATELATGKQSLQVEQPAQQQEPMAKPHCKVGGMPAPGRMCPKIIVGGKLCGDTGWCPHQIHETPASKPENK